jgi:hypothetical protein
MKQNVMVRRYRHSASARLARYQQWAGSQQIDVPSQNTIKGAVVQVKRVTRCSCSVTQQLQSIKNLPEQSLPSLRGIVQVQNTRY